MQKIDRKLKFKGNPRKISERQQELLKAHLEELGDLSGVVYCRNNKAYVGGNQRSDIFHGSKIVYSQEFEKPNQHGTIAIGWIEYNGELYAYREVEFTEEQFRKACIVANNDGGEWDYQELQTWDSEDLEEWGVNMPSFADSHSPNVGFDDNYDTDSDGVHAPERVKDGDLWQLGRHFLLCGDATDAVQVDRLLDGARPCLLITDPPYGVNYDPNWRVKALNSINSAVSKVENDHTAFWLPVWEKAAGFCDVAYVWHGGLHAEIVKLDLEAAGFISRAQIIWAKDGMVISRGAYHWQHEPCWYAVKKGASAKWIGDRSQTTLWNIPKPKKSETGHSTQKPIECMGRPMQNHEGDVFDPFVGSGSTIIAGEQIGRTVYAMELKPRHCDIVLDRWETFTGEKAVLCER